MATLLLLYCSVAFAQDPLYQEEPFDLITLDEHNDNMVLRVQLLPRPLPEHRASDTLTVRLVDRPEKAYRIMWHSIDKVELFEELVLKKANQLVAAGKHEEAYDYFKFLAEKHPKLPKLQESVQDYLFEEAKVAYRKAQYDAALAMLRELLERNPKYAGLDKAMGATTDKLIEQYAAAKNYWAARRLLRNLATAFPQQTTVAKWEGQLKGQAGSLMQQGRAAAREGDFAKAGRLTRQLIRIWPDLPGAEELARAIHQQYPRVVVGTSSPAVDPLPGRLNGWAALRSGRLLYRTLVEYAGPGTEGGAYESPVAEQVDAREFSRRMVIQIKPGIGWASGESTLTGYDVARRLLEMADPQSEAYRPEWSELLSGVSVGGVYRVEAELRRPFVRPDALLQTVLVPYGTAAAADSPPLPNGPFCSGTVDGNDVIYLANANYFAAGPTQPKELVERHFEQGALAIRALKQGEVQVLDRVCPWGLEIIRKDANLAVEPYAVPLVHCLIPNMRRPLTSKRTFRRALVYGIHRQAILDQLTQAEIPGCEVLSGPFPPGLGFDDPLGYAYDRSIEPRPYEPQLAIALAGVSVNELAAATKRKGKELKETPRLVLAHPPGEIARTACSSIKRQLELIGVPIELRRLAGAAPQQIPEDVDLLYAELALWDPVADARRLLGTNGMAAGCSSYMSLALRQLEQAVDWQQIHTRMRRLHLVAHRDVAVVPLWQLVEHFAYRRNLKGIGTRPITLYGNVEQWQLVFQYPKEEK